MKRVRIHLTLLDSSPSDHQRTVAFVEVNHLVDDDVDVAAYANQINARVFVEQDMEGTLGTPPRATVDLVPGAAA